VICHVTGFVATAYLALGVAKTLSVAGAIAFAIAAD
jgi:hypothetical protein